MTDQPAVAPELLRYVDDYIEEAAAKEERGGSAVPSELDSDSNLIIFCRELFGQLFANVIGEALPGIGILSAQRANVLRRTSGQEWSGALRRLVGHFQHLSKIYADLLVESYSDSTEVSDFHFNFMPSVLRDLETWANEVDPSLAAAVSDTRQRYDAYLANAE